MTNRHRRPFAPRANIAAEPLEPRVCLNAPGAAWPLVFADEFGGAAIDRTKWTTHLAWGGDTGDARHHNDAYASYMTDDNVVVSDGTLKLTTKRETVTAQNGRVFDYTQGFIQTADQFRSKYGHFEIRAKLPADAGPGLWPAFWTLADGWPPEDDIGEWWTSNGRLHQGLAHGADWRDVQWDDYNTYGSLPTGWHTYAMEWGPGYQHFLIDDRVRHTVRGDRVPDVAQYVILNSGVESASPPQPWTVFPNAFEVDYVRVYAFTADDGGAIASPSFEDEPQGANWNVSGNAVVQGTNARTGPRAMRLRGPWGYADQVIEGLQPSSVYELTGSAFLTAPGDAATLGVKEFGGAERTVAFAETSYQTRSVTFTTAADATTIRVFMVKSGGDATAYFDDLGLRYIGPAQTAEPTPTPTATPTPTPTGPTLGVEVLSVTSPKSTRAGEAARGKLRVRLTAPAGELLRGALAVDVLGSADGTLGDADPVLATLTRRAFKLKPGRSKVVTVRVESLPTDLAATGLYFFARARGPADAAGTSAAWAWPVIIVTPP